MKKLLLMFAAIAAMTFVACQPNNANQTEETQDTTAFNLEQFDQNLAAATDSASIADLLNNAQAEVQKLVEAGDTEGAKTLVEKIKEIINKNTEKLAAAVPAFGAMVEQFNTSMPEGIKDVVESADSLKDKAVDAVTDKANEVVDGAKEAVTEKANEVADKANEKVNEGVDKAKDAAKDAAKKIGL